MRIGGFHFLCAYMYAVGKSVRSSGFDEILVESGICASGSLEKVMPGKQYNRALQVHKLMLEALERLLLCVFESQYIRSMSKEAQNVRIQLAEKPSKEQVTLILSNAAFTALLAADITQFKKKVREGHLGRIAQFWLNYIDWVWLILQNQRAIKEGNLDLHMASLQQMCKLFFSYDQQNYVRYASVYLLILLNCHDSHPGAEDLLRAWS